MNIGFGPAEAEREVRLPVGEVELSGLLGVPANSRGLVVFVHGSGSSRLSPRNRYVAQVLRNAGLATLLFDLLTPEEEAEDEWSGRWRFDVPWLAERLVAVTDFLGRSPETASLPLGYFGASTGGGAALVAAAARPETVRAVVSRGGRPDMAGKALERVRVPVCLIVGGEDPVVRGLNEEALARLAGPAQLRIVPGATHLFPEPGALETVAAWAAEWFGTYLGGRVPAGPGT